VVYVVGSGRGQTWQHVYTAVTRGRSRVVIVTRKSMLDWALESHPITRCTRLSDKLLLMLNCPSDSQVTSNVSVCFEFMTHGYYIETIRFRGF